MFRARALDRRLFEKEQNTPKTENKAKKITEFSPFNFKTDERKYMKKLSEKDDTSVQESSTTFKAKEMPKYKFFEVKHDVQKKILF